MGNLITELPVSEMNATLEIFDRLGVDRDGLKRFRKASSWEQMTVAQMMQNGITERQKAELAPASPKFTIDLSSPCRLPFDGATLEVHGGTGTVTLERRGEDLYLDRTKIELFLSKGQQGQSVVVGHKLRKELEKRGKNMGGKVLDCLVDHPELWPESWKKDSQGRTVYVFFWDDIFRNSDGDPYVRFGYWLEGEVVSGFSWLDYDWSVHDPAASLAS